MKTYIKQNEGSNKNAKGRHFPYVCSVGKITIGYGRNLSDNGINEYEATIMLDADISDASTDIRKVFNYEEFEHLSFSQKMALTDMMFNLGRTRFSKFKKMIQAVKDKDFNKAADEIMDSTYAKQVHGRARKNAELMRRGYGSFKDGKN